MRAVAKESGRSGYWSLVAWMGVIVGYLILSYYSVIAGWATAYVFETAGGAFSGISSSAAAAHFDDLLASPKRLIFWHTVFMLMTALIISRGVHRGIERAVRILMPALFLMLLALIGYSAYAGDMQAAVQFLFTPVPLVDDSSLRVSAPQNQWGMVLLMDQDDELTRVFEERLMFLGSPIMPIPNRP